MAEQQGVYSSDDSDREKSDKLPPTPGQALSHKTKEKYEKNKASREEVSDSSVSSVRSRAKSKHKSDLGIEKLPIHSGQDFQLPAPESQTRSSHRDHRSRSHSATPSDKPNYMVSKESLIIIQFNIQ